MAMIKVSDYIVRRVADLGVTHVFLVTGGGAMHLDDSLGNEPRRLDARVQPPRAGVRDRGRGLRTVARRHRRRRRHDRARAARTRSPACSASGTTRCRRSTSRARCATTRPSPRPACRCGSSATRRPTSSRIVAPDHEVRGDGHRPDRRSATTSSAPCTSRAPAVPARCGSTSRSTCRPRASTRTSCEPTTRPRTPPRARSTASRARAGRASSSSACARAERPVILAGSGDPHRGRVTTRFLRRRGRGSAIPVATAWNAHDLMYEDHPLYAGRPGTHRRPRGQLRRAERRPPDRRSAAGSTSGRSATSSARSRARRTGSSSTSTPLELAKPTILPGPARPRRRRLLPRRARRERSTAPPLPDRSRVARVVPRAPCARYPVVLPEYRRGDRRGEPVRLRRRALRAPRGGRRRRHGERRRVRRRRSRRSGSSRGQRLIGNSGTASMGYDLPAAIGAACRARRRRVICLAGDGSIQMNLQELQTIVGTTAAGEGLRLRQRRLPLDPADAGQPLRRALRGREPAQRRDASPTWSRLAEAYGIPARRVERARRARRRASLRRSPTTGPALLRRRDGPGAARSSRR